MSTKECLDTLSRIFVENKLYKLILAVRLQVSSSAIDKWFERGSVPTRHLSDVENFVREIKKEKSVARRKRRVS
jgi:hypothetical protein